MILLSTRFMQKIQLAKLTPALFFSRRVGHYRSTYWDTFSIYWFQIKWTCFLCFYSKKRLWVCVLRKVNGWQSHLTIFCLVYVEHQQHLGLALNVLYQRSWLYSRVNHYSSKWNFLVIQPRVTWLRNGLYFPLDESRVKVSTDPDRTSSLQIECAQLVDIGSYSVRAEHPYGKSSSRCELDMRRMLLSYHVIMSWLIWMLCFYFLL